MAYNSFYVFLYYLPCTPSDAWDGLNTYLKMKYLEYTFSLHPYSEDAADLLAALAGEAGFEAFDATEGGLTGYVRTTQANSSQLDSLIAEFPIPGVDITYAVRQAEDKNWNESWEAHGLKPVVIDDMVYIAPSLPTSGVSHPYHIQIKPKQAFGTGQHHTTAMIISYLLHHDIAGQQVLDAGCGTGVLGIFSAMRGASSVTAYDIDKWSVENTKYHLELNGITNTTVLLGDSSVLQDTTRRYHLILANINRNILLADLPVFAHLLTANGQIVMSGFMAQDVPYLKARAEELGLAIIHQTHHEEWQMLVLERIA